MTRSQAGGAGAKRLGQFIVPDRSRSHSQIFFARAFLKVKSYMPSAFLAGISVFEGEIPLARPEFKPTNDQRRRVMLCHAVGMSNKHIADALGIDEKTLTKHFARELLNGPRIIKQELLAAVTAQAIKGKRSAITLLERMTRDQQRRSG